MSSSILRLRAAAAAGGCRQFASSAVGLMLPSNKMYSLGEKKVVNITNNIEKESEWDTVVGSSHGWVGLVKRKYLSVWNPMSGDHIMLPPIVGKLSIDMIEKMIVDDAECSRVVIVGSSMWLGVCCPGRCSEWTVFGRGRQNHDVVACSQRKFYTIQCNSDVERWSICPGDELVRWNISEPRRPRMEWKMSLSELEDEEGNYKLPRTPNCESCISSPHLVYAEHSDQLFLVTRHYNLCTDRDGSGISGDRHWYIYPYMTVGFDVHLVEQLSSGKGQLRHMKHSLDGLVMFIGINDSFAVSAADFPHLKPDSIYYTDHHEQTRYIHLQNWVHGGHDVGVYDYKNEVVSSCYFPVDHHCFKRTDDPPPFWFTPTSTK